MESNEKLPALRSLDVTPFRNSGNQPYFALHDHAQIASGPVAVSLPCYFVLAHLDGRHSRGEVQEAFRRQFGQPLAPEQFDRLLATLDEALLLDNERFAQAYAARQAAYRAAPVRESRDRYPDAHALRSEIEQMLAGGAGACGGEVRGIIAPHLDYRRGGPCYAQAYGALRQAGPAQRYVILGTNHAGRARSVVATRKDFQTPLGLVTTDRAFIERIEKRLGGPICEDEFDHDVEHSVELQVHVLQVCADQRRFEIVPVLCPDPCGPTAQPAGDSRGPDLDDFADALGELIAEADRPTVVIAGADLSHVGQRFGDPERLTREFLEQVERRDRVLLSLLEQGKEGEFVEALRVAGNPTRICSAGCVYAALRALPNRACRVLAYHQAADFETQTNVSCVAAVIG